MQERSHELSTDRHTDAAPLKAWVRALESIRPLAQDAGLTLPGLLDEICDRFASNPALMSPDETVTYEEFGRRCHQYARWALERAIQPGQVVCLLMRNRVDYPAIWLGITAVGGVVALLNTGLPGAALAHSIAVAAPAHLIASAEFAPAIAAIAAGLPQSCRCWIVGGPEGTDPHWPVLDRDHYAAGPLGPGERRAARSRDTALLIYTSGTTGLPKAARISHYRVLEWGFWFAGMMDVRSDDRLYDCLPMYHSTGGIVATGAMLLRGASVVVRERFAASRFWQDVADSGSTIFLYIGELCRYLAAAPEDPRERDHGLRLCVGNGLRGDVWEGFARRFRIPRILEFYASTEGNVSLYNLEGRPGAIGRVPSFLAHRFGVLLIECDAEPGVPLRGADGRCIRCQPGAVGEAVGRIASADSTGTTAFEGYTDAAANAGKVLRDVVEHGDSWFRTGDLMRRDAAGFYYFVDRIGDTFRWKGENVSTTQVSQALCAYPGVREALVYGVEIAGTEGRAGMAAITTGPGFRLAELYVDLERTLPEYARPLFLRMCGALDMTGTYKPVKARLAAEGFDPAVARETLYFRDAANAAFIKVDAELYRRLMHGAIRF